jgi:mRNA-degrading endonuclease toxin of MazEF toxin-antitoxin module
MLLAAAFCFTLAAAADTLELRDGRVVNGKYLGGTQSQVRFEVNGKVELYSVDKILALTFSGDARVGDDDNVPRPAPVVTPNSYNRHRGDSVTVPAGTRILVRMIDSVDSEKNRVGDKFRASLESDLEVDGVVVAPKGTDVYGRLAEAKEAGHMSGKSELKLELTDILINQKLQPIMTGEYELAGKSRGSNTAKKVGGGAVAGAVIGAIAGGGKGAAIGAGVGAGAGTAIQVFTRGEQVRVPSETMLEFRIEQPFTVTPAGTK